MRLTTKGRYAVTAMLDIALHSGTGPVSVQDIALRQGISSAYLEQIVGRLKRIGLLSSHRGPGGGYCLGRDAAQINISAIVAAVGEGVDATRCAGRADCQEGHMCLTHDLWVDLSAQIDGFLQHVTLASLVDRQDVLRVNQRQDQDHGGSGDADTRIAATLLS
jgi:Rrf2 family iron-sulfur cluster assembly transcriptional regulator